MFQKMYNELASYMAVAVLLPIFVVYILVSELIRGTKRMSNAIFFYLYLQYYRARLRYSFRFMVKECLEHSQDLREVE